MATILFTPLYTYASFCHWFSLHINNWNASQTCIRSTCQTDVLVFNTWKHVTWIICWSVFLIGYWSHHWALEKEQGWTKTFAASITVQREITALPILLFLVYTGSVDGKFSNISAWQQWHVLQYQYPNKKFHSNTSCLLYMLCQTLLSKTTSIDLPFLTPCFTIWDTGLAFQQFFYDNR